MDNRLIQQLITGLAMIIVFISLKASPFDRYITGYWLLFLIGGILLFIFSPTIAKKLNGGT